uniref:Uncharacterized protein n=1 Tax=Arundo donax TaxID=35708 RepID=A0A0A8ZRB9_ARUDO
MLQQDVHHQLHANRGSH